MIKLNVLVLFLLFLTSCKVLKDKKDITQDKTTIKEVYKKADTLTYVVPKTVYKDTTIYVKNFEKRGSNTLKIVYDKEGKQSQIDCMSEGIRELSKVVESLKDKSKTKESDFKDINMLYIFLGLAFLLVINKLSNKFI